MLSTIPDGGRSYYSPDAEGGGIPTTRKSSRREVPAGRVGLHGTGRLISEALSGKLQACPGGGWGVEGMYESAQIAGLQGCSQNVRSEGQTEAIKGHRDAGVRA